MQRLVQYLQHKEVVHSLFKKRYIDLSISDTLSPLFPVYNSSTPRSGETKPIRGKVSQGVWETEVPQQVQGQSPGRGPGGESRPDDEAFLHKDIFCHYVEGRGTEVISVWRVESSCLIMLCKSYRRSYVLFP